MGQTIQSSDYIKIIGMLLDKRLPLDQRVARAAARREKAALHLADDGNHSHVSDSTESEDLKKEQLDVGKAGER
jgi:hypothetical protein